MVVSNSDRLDSRMVHSSVLVEVVRLVVPVRAIGFGFLVECNATSAGVRYLSLSNLGR
jgi:hypothetical protein